MKILITGVAGLLGSRLADFVLANKLADEVIGIDDLSGGYLQNVDNRVKFYNKNILDPDLSLIFKGEKPDYVFHFAAYAAEGLSPFIRSFNYDNNLKSTALIVNECIKNNVKRIVFTSSMAVYGHGYGGYFDEDQKPTPIDPYGVAKYACEMDIQIAGEQHDLDWCIIRPHNVYGKNQNIWDKYRNVLGIWMYQALNNMDYTIFGDGLQTRSFSYIDDSLLPLWKAAVDQRASKQIINLGGIEQHSIKEANEVLRTIIGYGEVTHLEQRHEVKHSIPKYQKSVDLLDFQHKTNLTEGLTEMWDWAKKQPMRERFVWNEYELDKGIYSFWSNKK
jgi:UDP-glucose 4-epimerase